MIYVHWINFWRYWMKPYNFRDFTFLEITLYCELLEGTRLVFCNLGITIRWNR